MNWGCTVIVKLILFNNCLIILNSPFDVSANQLSVKFMAIFKTIEVWVGCTNEIFKNLNQIIFQFAFHGTRHWIYWAVFT